MMETYQKDRGASLSKQPLANEGNFENQTGCKEKIQPARD